MSKSIIIPQNEINEIIEKYNDYYSIIKLSKIYNYSESVIKNNLIKNGIHIRDLRESHELPYDKTYFEKIDTPNKAYWLGFIYADGSISKRNIFSIKLTINDKEHLYKLKEDMNAKHIIGEYEMETQYGHVKYCMFNIHNIQLCEQLKKLGVNQNKTQECNFPNENIIPKKYIWDFIRGFFDGDGSVYKSNIQWRNIKYQYPSISFTGTEHMLSSILKEIKKYYDTNTSVRKYYNDKSVYDLKFGGSNLVNTIYHLLYDNAQTYLERKKEVFDYFLDNENNLRTVKELI